MSDTILALDIGKKYIGIARANIIAKIAEPLFTIPNNENTNMELKKIVEDYNVNCLIVGLPRSLEGRETAQTNFVRRFAKNNLSFIKVIFQDEALTSINAEKILKSRKLPYVKQDIDSLAAALILDDYLQGVTYETIQ